MNAYEAVGVPDNSGGIYDTNTMVDILQDAGMVPISAVVEIGGERVTVIAMAGSKKKTVDAGLVREWDAEHGTQLNRILVRDRVPVGLGWTAMGAAIRRADEDGRRIVWLTTRRFWRLFGDDETRRWQEDADREEFMSAGVSESQAVCMSLMCMGYVSDELMTLAMRDAGIDRQQYIDAMNWMPVILPSMYQERYALSHRPRHGAHATNNPMHRITIIMYGRCIESMTE